MATKQKNGTTQQVNRSRLSSLLRWKIAQKVDDKWEALAKELDLPSNAINEIKKDSKFSTDQFKADEVIKRWSDNNGLDTDEYRELGNALRNIQMGNEAEKYLANADPDNIH